MKCLVCSNSISPFIDFGKQPIANGFLSPNQFKDEYFFDMKIAFCTKCFMVQLTEQPDRSKMFHNNYAFYSSTSRYMVNHFEQFANDVIEKYRLTRDSYVIEIGSNDGIMLKHFANKSIGHLGVEPSANVAEVAENQGINIVIGFFDENLKIYRKADVILAANVMAHISNINSVIREIKNLLKLNGILIFEDPYLGDILSKISYDQIYDEHAFFFSLTSISELFNQHGMEVVDVQPQEVHGGSMRYTVANKGHHAISASVDRLLEKEQWLGLSMTHPYKSFKESVEESAKNLKDILISIKSKGENIVGYAATAKSATITNYCGIGPDLIDYICDTTPIKQGKFSPGAHIPVKPYQEFLNNPPTHALLFAWNHAEEIMEKEKNYKGKWIMYVPEIKIL